MACKKNFSRNTSCRATSAEGLKVCIEKLRTSVGAATGLMKLDRNEMVFTPGLRSGLNFNRLRVKDLA